MIPIEQRQRIRIGRMANRCGCRIARPRPEDAVDLGAYRLVDLVNNRVLLGEAFDASLEEIEAYLRRERNPHKTPEEIHENIVRQLANQRGYVVRKSRPRLYVKSAGEYQLFCKSDPTTPVIVRPDRSPTVDELEAFLRAQAVGSQKRLYSPRPQSDHSLTRQGVRL